MEPGETLNAHLWVAAALAVLDDLERRGKIGVIEGGTGLWVDALLDGLSLAGVPPNPDRRAELEELSTEQLAGLVRRLDPGDARVYFKLSRAYARASRREDAARANAAFRRLSEQPGSAARE